VLIGCFGDPGLLALRESSPAPVTGLADAAFAEAARLGRFAVVTGGARWPAMLQRLARMLGHGDALAGVLAVAPSGAELAANPDAACALLADACRQAARLDGVRSVILGGAGLAGLTVRIQPMVEVPLIDSLQAGVRHALALVAAGVPPGSGPPRAGFDVVWQQLSAGMSALGRVDR
jgi:Asp/Glu/hydantoin racemase